MKKLLCKIGLHSWITSAQYFPNIDAPIVTRFFVIKKCKWCKKLEILQDVYFDEITGQPIEHPATIAGRNI